SFPAQYKRRRERCQWTACRAGLLRRLEKLFSLLFLLSKGFSNFGRRIMMPASKEVKGLEALKEALMGALENHVAFTIPVLGGIPVADAVVVTWIVMAVWMILALA